jgi:hypothetical protein
MMTTSTPFNRSDVFSFVEPGLPYFLDGIDGDNDDPVDWWLDLGAVDLAGVPGM